MFFVVGGMAEQKGLPSARAGTNRFGYPRNSTCVGVEGMFRDSRKRNRNFVSV